MNGTLDNDESTIILTPFLGAPAKKPNRFRTLRKVIIGILLLFTLAGLVLSCIAIYLPSWQVVHYTEYMHADRKEYSMHEHGLWQDCNRNIRKDLGGYDGDDNAVGPSQCIYKWDYEDLPGRLGDHDLTHPDESELHHFHGWQIAVLTLLGLALLTAAISMCLSYCSCLYRSFAFTVTGTTFLTLALSASALLIFFFYAHRAENRFVSVVLTHEQLLGSAFYFELGALAAHLLSFMFSLAVLITSLRERSKKDPLLNHQDQELVSLSQMSKSTGPNIQRTLEVDPPLLYQQTTGKVLSQSTPHYVKNQSNNYRSPAASLPELPPKPPIRRGSETCV